jgi:TPR repeat protein
MRHNTQLLRAAVTASLMLVAVAGAAVAGPKEDTAAAIPFRAEAEQGDVSAQIMLGILYDEGRFVLQDYAEAVRWYRKAADQGHKGAQALLGAMYERGRGVHQDYVQAHMWYNLAAAQGSVGAADSRERVEKAMTPAQVAEAQKLAREWKPKRDRVFASPFEEAIAAYNSQDYASALQLLRPLAESGNVRAQFLLGFMYEGGIGVLPDDIEAVKWYQRAADTGDDYAQYHMGIMHMNGRGVPRDLVSAYMWLDLAAMQGHQGAATARDSLARSVSAAQIAEAQKLAREWKPKPER